MNILSAFRRRPEPAITADVILDRMLTEAGLPGPAADAMKMRTRAAGRAISDRRAAVHDGLRTNFPTRRFSSLPGNSPSAGSTSAAEGNFSEQSK